MNVVLPDLVGGDDFVEAFPISEAFESVVNDQSVTRLVINLSKSSMSFGFVRKKSAPKTANPSRANITTTGSHRSPSNRPASQGRDY
jgi:hypothetical protein